MPRLFFSFFVHHEGEVETKVFSILAIGRSLFDPGRSVCVLERIPPPGSMLIASRWNVIPRIEKTQARMTDGCLKVRGAVWRLNASVQAPQTQWDERGLAK